MMQTVQLFHADGQPRLKGPDKEIVTGYVLGTRRSSIQTHHDLVVADIILAESPGPGLSRHITAFIQGSA
jgi:hypothetical protein